MRRVTDLNGVRWSVDVSWTDRRFGTHLRRFRTRERRPSVAPEMDSDQAEDEGRWRWLEFVDLLGVDLPGLVALVALLALVVAAIIAFPWLPIVLLDLVELLIFPALAVVVVAWRVMRRRPFTIAASREGVLRVEWRAVGVRKARRIERAVAEAIRVGGDPASLFPDDSSGQVGHN